MTGLLPEDKVGLWRRVEPREMEPVGHVMNFWIKPLLKPGSSWSFQFSEPVNVLVLSEPVWVGSIPSRHAIPMLYVLFHLCLTHTL